jgi:hypothetical protein
MRSINATLRTTFTRSNEMNPIDRLIIHEAMSRARMLGPQDYTSEASRPAREIAMRARNAQKRIWGHR